MTPTSWPDLPSHNVAGVGNAGLFDDGEGVHVGADQQVGPAVLQNADHAVCLAAVGIDADMLGDGVAGFAPSSPASRAEVCCRKCESSQGWEWMSL